MTGSPATGAQSLEGTAQQLQIDACKRKLGKTSGTHRPIETVNMLAPAPELGRVFPAQPCQLLIRALSCWHPLHQRHALMWPS